MIRELFRTARDLEGRAAFCLVHKETGKEISYRKHEPFYAASLVKLAVLYEALRQVDAKTLTRDTRINPETLEHAGGHGIINLLHNEASLTLEDLLVLMIAVSDNTAANTMITLLGMDRMNTTMEALGLFHTRVNRLLMDRTGKPNMTCAGDMAMLFDSLLVPHPDVPLSPESRSFALEVCRKQQHHMGFPSGLRFCAQCKEFLAHKNQCCHCKTHAWQQDPFIPPIAHKTGEVPGVCHDAGILEGSRGLCIAVGLSEGLADNHDGYQFLHAVSMAAYLWTGESK